jgi:hypothetical protein
MAPRRGRARCRVGRSFLLLVGTELLIASCGGRSGLDALSSGDDVPGGNNGGSWGRSPGSGSGAPSVGGVPSAGTTPYSNGGSKAGSRGGGGAIDLDAGRDAGSEDSTSPRDVHVRPPVADSSNAVVCAGIAGDLQGLDIWSDARGPFLLASAADSGIAVLSRRAGSWIDIYRHDPAVRHAATSLVGFPDGDLVLGGDFSCGGALVLSGGQAHCTAGFVPADIFVVSNRLAYALAADRVLVYDGSLWTQFLEPLESGGVRLAPWRVWADDTEVAAAMQTGEILVSENGEPFAMRGRVPVDDEPGTFLGPVIWGFGGDDLWVGLRNGTLYSYDGANWSERAKVDDACGGGIRGIWGKDGLIYLHTEHEFIRWDGKLEVLGDFPCTATIRAIWGSSASEVFLAVANSTASNSACGEAEVFEWTGTDLVRI